MITITLDKIREYSPCTGGWKKVKAAHKHIDGEFPLSSVLDSNDLGDTLWCLRCLPEHDKLWRKYAVWCARQVEHLMTGERSKRALDVAWAHSCGKASDEDLAAAWAAAGAAAAAAAGDAAAAAWAAAGAAARAAALDAAGDAAWDAAGDAAWDAAWDAALDAAWAAQAKKLKQILDAGEWVDD